MINPSYLFGMGKKYKFGNILHRQIMQVANILVLNGENPDAYCTNIPNGYVPKNNSSKEINSMYGVEAKLKIKM